MVAPLFGHTLLPSPAFSAWLTRELICISALCVCVVTERRRGWILLEACLLFQAVDWCVCGSMDGGEVEEEAGGGGKSRVGREDVSHPCSPR